MDRKTYYSTYDTIWTNIQSKRLIQTSAPTTLRGLPELNLRKAKAWLSVGPGIMDAEIIRHCSPSLESFVGVDPYAKCIKETAPAFDESLNIKHIKFVNCTIEEYCGEKDSVDIVMMAHVLYHMQGSITDCVNRMIDLVKPGGHVIIIINKGYMEDGSKITEHIARICNSQTLDAEGVIAMLEQSKIAYKEFTTKTIMEIGGRLHSKALLELFIRREPSTEEVDSFWESMKTRTEPGTSKCEFNSSIIVVPKNENKIFKQII